MGDRGQSTDRFLRRTTTFFLCPRKAEHFVHDHRLECVMNGSYYKNSQVKWVLKKTEERNGNDPLKVKYDLLFSSLVIFIGLLVRKLFTCLPTTVVPDHSTFYLLVPLNCFQSIRVYVLDDVSILLVLLNDDVQ